MPPSFARDGVAAFGRMDAWTPSISFINPPKRINRIKELLSSKSPRVCVVRGEGIGDLIMTTPTIHALRGLFNNNLHMTVATNTKYLGGALPKVLRGNPDIDRVVDRQDLDESDYDVVISLHCPAIAHERPMAPPINRIDLFARHVGFGPLEDPVPRLFLDKEEIAQGSQALYYLGLYGKKVMMVNLFASSQARSIDSVKVRSALTTLYKDHKIHSLIVCHNSDKNSDVVWGDIPGSVILKDKDIRELSSIMVHCDLLLCPDSALLHAGGALGMPTVSLFGPTDPRARINYYQNAVAIWEGEHLGGHPHWYEACPYGNLCWKLITEDHIVGGCLMQLQNTRKVNLDALEHRPIRTQVI